jgi:putative endonuclease
MAIVYILKTESGKYYIGSTTNISDRLEHHQVGHTPSTSKMGKIDLVFSQEYPSLSEASVIEKRLKKLKRRDYIEKIIKEGVIKMRV